MMGSILGSRDTKDKSSDDTITLLNTYIHSCIAFVPIVFCAVSLYVGCATEMTALCGIVSLWDCTFMFAIAV